MEAMFMQNFVGGTNKEYYDIFESGLSMIPII